MRTAIPEPDPTLVAGGAPTSRGTPRGDRDRIGAVLEELRPRLQAVALRVTRDADAAQDVLQNAFEKVLRHRDQFRGEARPSTWMHRIVVNEALMWLRSERRRGRHLSAVEDLEQLPVRDGSETAAERIERRAEVERVRRAVATLAPEERVVIERCALEGRSYRRFGADVGLHPSAAKSRAFRARRRLRELLQAAPGAASPSRVRLR